MQIEGTSTIDYGVTRSGLTQLRRSWDAGSGARGIALVIHGINEHSGRYERVGRMLADARIHAVAIDQRGHGQSGGRRTYIDRFEDFLDDVEDQLAQVNAMGLPVAIIGHSMGGLISATYAVSDRPQPDLLVLSGAALDAEVPKWQRVAAPYLGKLVPKFFLPAAFDAEILSRDPEVGAAYNADPLIRAGATAGLGAQMFRAMEETTAALHNLRVPTLALHGGDDALVPPSATEVLEGHRLIERRVLPGLRHEIFNEPEGPQVIGEVIQWLLAGFADLA